MRSAGSTRYPRFSAPVDVALQNATSKDNPDARVFFNNRGVIVTGARFILPGNQTYAMDGITTVRMHKDIPSQIGPILCILGGVSTGVFSSAFIWIAVAPILVGIFWIALLKPRFSVVLNSTFGETEALEGKDGRWIQDIVWALDKAIADRGG